jgi:histidine kinase/DNA gyrase B/HSP90-like ATPase
VISDLLKTKGKQASFVEVKISTELVHLLSDQLYQSPLKALEELVINSYDAGAKICRLFVPSASQISEKSEFHFISVFDTGTGLTDEGMVDLWHIGRSNKRTEEIEKISARKQIGKFGIGKLATYTVAEKLTYISKTKNGITSATLDFAALTRDASGVGKPVTVPLIHIENWASFSANNDVKLILDAMGVTSTDLASPSWTLVVLDSLKTKAQQIRLNTLQWVLRTAMPLQAEFRLFLNTEELKSVKDDYELAAKFAITELPAERLKALKEKTGEAWSVRKGKLVAASFPSGISGSVLVTTRTLPGKSDDLLRSNGFFVRVLGRLINQDEPFFGMTHLHYGTLSRFRADIDANDLDAIITAPRESVGTSLLKDNFEALLLEIFQEARQRYENFLKQEQEDETNKKEHSRSFVSPTLMEHAIASALIETSPTTGAESDASWFYFSIQQGTNLQELIAKLYSSDRQQFVFRYAGLGKSSRLVSFQPADSTFVINSDHEFVEAYTDDAHSRLMLEDMVLAEALLEAQLRNAKIPSNVIGEALQNRDSLLRGLALDHPYSSHAIARSLSDSAANEHNLEIALVAAARSLGFVARHISGSGEPDGIASFVEYPAAETFITLEAKSSEGIPTLAQLDFAGLAEHVADKKAQGCLLIAPKYPASSDDEGAAASRAREQKISCWTIADLARVVDVAETRHINAKQILEIVQRNFAPNDVKEAVNKLFVEPSWDQPTLSNAIVEALRLLEGRLVDSPRTVSFVATILSANPNFLGIRTEDVRKAVSQLAAASQGALVIDGERLVMLTSYDELARRLSTQTGNGGLPLRPSKLRSDLGSSGDPEKES